MPRQEDPRESTALRRIVRASVGEQLRAYYDVTLELPMSEKLAIVVEYLERVETQQIIPPD